MLNELLLALFLTQVGTVTAITACIVGVMALFYTEIIALDKFDAEKPLEDPARPIGQCEQGIHAKGCLDALQEILRTMLHSGGY